MDVRIGIQVNESILLLLLRRIAEPPQASNGWSKEIFASTLIHPGICPKPEPVCLLRIYPVMHTYMTFRMILTLSLVDEWIHSRAMLMSFVLG